jgi:hypothetical protein
MGVKFYRKRKKLHAEMKTDQKMIIWHVFVNNLMVL